MSITKAQLADIFDGPILFADSEVPVLASLAADAEVVVEIGTGHGAAAVLFSWAMRGGMVITYDPFLDGAGEGHAVTTAMEAHSHIGWALFSGKLNAAIVVRQVPSAQGAQEWSDWPIDLLFIDGDHRYEAVKADVAAWLPKVIAGGLLVLHDSRVPEQPCEFGKGMPGPLRVAQELAADDRLEFVRGVHSLTVWRVR